MRGMSGCYDLGMFRGRWTWITAGVVLVALAGGAVAIIRQEAARKNAAVRPAARREAPPPVQITLPVHIRAQQTVPVRAPFSGNVEQFMVEVGEEVYEGQVLARLSNIDMQNSHENATTALATMQARISRIDPTCWRPASKPPAHAPTRSARARNWSVPRRHGSASRC